MSTKAAKTTTATKAKETKADKPADKDQKANEAQARKDEHRTTAVKDCKALLETITSRLKTVIADVEGGVTSKDAFKDLHAATAEFKVAVNRIGIHANPQAKKAD